MEYTTTSEIAVKKLGNMLRLMMKRGKTLGKSLNDFMLRHHTALDSVRCRSLDDVHVSFVYPLEYEFSCSSSPPHHQRSYTPGHLRRRNTNYHNGRYYHQNHHHHHSRRSVYMPMMCEDVLGSKDVTFCGGDVAVEPLRRRRTGRRVRVTEWEPLFPLKSEEEEEWHVDKAAQEFIDKFYRDLMLQKWNSV